MAIHSPETGTGPEVAMADVDVDGAISAARRVLCHLANRRPECCASTVVTR